jgi:putative transposase
MQKFTETEIQKILKEHESGISLRELSRKYVVNRNTIMNWKQKYGGMVPSDMRKLKELEEEHNRLKKMYADLSMQHHALKEVLSKKF